MTPKQFLKANPEKYVMVTFEFGNPIYIAPAKTTGLFDIGITDKQDEAIVWSALDNTPNKLLWHMAKTGYKSLEFKIIP